MKNLFPFTVIIAIAASAFVVSCKATSNGFYDSGSKKNRTGMQRYDHLYSGSGNGSGQGTPAPVFGYFTAPSENGDGLPSSPLAQAGVLTGGETNDLSKWDLWGDMVQSELEEQKLLWKMFPYNRYAVILQTKDGMPVQGAKTSLVGINGEVLWQAVSDNTGTTQLWAGMFNDSMDVKATSIRIEYKGLTEVINNPVSFSNGVNTKSLDVPYFKSNEVDIAFAVDATASMQDEIDFLKEELKDILQKTKERYTEIDLRLASVFYRCADNSYVTKIQAFSGDVTLVSDFIKAQNADEGGTEALEIALADAVEKLEWRDNARTRLLFFVLDEPSGYSPEVIEKLHVQIQQAAKKGIKIIPVVASGSGNADIHDRNLEFLMRSAAMATNGNYIFITDHSGVGGTHTVPVIDHFDVELLNAMLLRTIHNNIYMPDKLSEPSKPVLDTLIISNTDALVSDYLDTLNENLEDSALMAALLPYTDFPDVETLEKNTPLADLDTSALLANSGLEVHTLKIYPVPTAGNVTVEFSAPVDWLYIADLNGKLICRLDVSGLSRVETDLSPYPDGIYFIQYQWEERWISGKVVLQK